MLGLINGLAGFALLFAGRKLFWLFVGIVGFITGARLTTIFWQGSDWLLILVGVMVGIVFALLTVFLQNVAILIAGFLAGGYIISALAAMSGFEEGNISWIVYIIGGLIGMAVISFLFDWSVIILSSIAGAVLITQNLFSQYNSVQFILIVLVIAGVIVQGSLLRHSKGSEVKNQTK